MENSDCGATWKAWPAMTAGSGTSCSSRMTRPSSRYRVSGRRVGGPATLHLVLRLTVTVPGPQESQLLAPPGRLGPLTPLQWDEEQQLAGVESLSRLCGLLLDEGSHPRAPAEPADLGPAGKADLRSLSTPLGPSWPSHGGWE